MDHDKILRELKKMLDLHLETGMETSVCVRLYDRSMLHVRFTRMAADRVREIERQAFECDVIDLNADECPF